MGIDYGNKRIGVAISDPWCTMAHPLEVINVRKDNSHVKKIEDIINKYEITNIVVGLPYNMNGTIGDGAKTVMEWAKQLEERVNLPVTLFDERLTTCEAHELLAGANVRGKKKRQVIDKIAASVILKEYLDSIKP
jgi:putative Holliday junction resolvase